MKKGLTKFLVIALAGLLLLSGVLAAQQFLPVYAAGHAVAAEEPREEDKPTYARLLEAVELTEQEKAEELPVPDADESGDSQSEAVPIPVKKQQNPQVNKTPVVVAQEPDKPETVTVEEKTTTVAEAASTEPFRLWRVQGLRPADKSSCPEFR